MTIKKLRSPCLLSRTIGRTLQGPDQQQLVKVPFWDINSVTGPTSVTWSEDNIVVYVAELACQLIRILVLFLYIL